VVAVTAGAKPSVVDAMLSNDHSAPIDKPLRAVLGLLEKLTRQLTDVTSADLARARAFIVTDDAIEEAMRVCFRFCLIDRLADALDFILPTARSLSGAAGFGRRAAAHPSRPCRRPQLAGY